MCISPPPLHHLHSHHRALKSLKVVVVVVIVLVVVIIVPIVIVVGHHAHGIEPGQEEGQEAESVEPSSAGGGVLTSTGVSAPILGREEDNISLLGVMIGG